MTPSKIGKYGVSGVLARSPSEDVFLAEASGRRVTITLFTPAGAAERERLIGEARRVAGLTHPNVAPMEVGLHAEQPFLLAEMAGPSLEAWLKEGPGLAEQLPVVEGIAAALSYVHEQGVLHRNLTPAAVVVAPDGEPKLLNFGLEPRPKPEGRAAAYTAPEVREGSPCSAQADIYSAGVVVYELLSGKGPEAGVPRPLRELRPDLPRDLADAVMACRELAPDWRPKDLSFLLEVTRKLRGATPRPARSATRLATGAVARGGRAAARSGSRTPLFAGAAVAALALGAGAFVLLRPAKPERAAEVATPAAHAPPPETAPPTPAAAAPPTTAPAPSPTPTLAPTTTLPRVIAPTPTPAPPAAARPTPAPVAPAARVATAAPSPVPTAPPTTAPAPSLPATPPPPTTNAPPASGPPALKALSPPTLRRGSRTLVDLRGVNLRAGLVPVLSKGKGAAPGLSATRPRVVNDGLLQFFVEVNPAADTGSYTLVLQDSAGASSNPIRFEVTK